MPFLFPSLLLSNCSLDVVYVLPLGLLIKKELVDT